MNEPNDLYNFVLLKKLIEQPRFSKSYQSLIHLANCFLGFEGSATTFSWQVYYPYSILSHSDISVRRKVGAFQMSVAVMDHTYLRQWIAYICVHFSALKSAFKRWVHFQSDFFFWQIFFLLSFTCTRRQTHKK